MRSSQVWFRGLSDRAQGVIVILGFLVVVAATWAATVIPEEFVGRDVNPSAGLISSWPAGPIEGVRLLVQDGVPDVDECIEVSQGSVLELVSHTEESTLWVFADPDAKLSFSWLTDELQQQLFVPSSHLANESNAGRVSITFAGRTDDAVIRVEAHRESARLCGVQPNAGADGGPLDETELVTSWPSGPLAGTPPLVVDGTVDESGCIDLAENASVELMIDSEPAAVWVFASADARVRFDRLGERLEQSSYIPEDHLANESAPGRVTVTFAGGDTDTLVQVVAARSGAQICGVRS